MEVEIYTRSIPVCQYCLMAKKMLEEKSIPYKEYVITDDINEETLRLKVKYVDKEKLLERAPGARSVPQIFIDGEHVGGVQELKDHLETMKDDN